MSHWEKEHQATIRAHLGNIQTTFLGFNVLNRRTTQGIAPKKLPYYDLILGYDAEHKIYIAWSSYAHQIMTNDFDSHTFSLHKHSSEILNNSESICSFYQRLDGTKKVSVKTNGDLR